VAWRSGNKGGRGTVNCHFMMITKFHFTSVASFINADFPATWLTSQSIRETHASRYALIPHRSEFYLAHKIAMDVSFHIVFGIFIPHTATIANQAP
jgi:hypothetical protein